MSAPFTINIDSLTNLDPSRAVEFFRRLLWAEATKVGIGINLIDVPNNIYVSDGGIDAFIEDANHIDDELIPKGTTGFQIKSGKDSGDEGFKRELHVKNNLDLPLKPEINRILNNGGGYVLVLFDELTTEKKLDRRKAIRNEIKRMGFKNPSVRVYSANQIQGYAEKYIALILWLSGSFNTAYPYSSWSKFRSITGLKNYVPDEPRKAIIELIKDKIRNDEKCSIIRIDGLPGIGKTRLVWEALYDDDLNNLVIYSDAHNFTSSTLMSNLVNNPENSAILVIDDCSITHHNYIVNRYSNAGKRLNVITISNEMEDTGFHTERRTIGQLGRSEMEEIIKSERPDLPMNVVDRLSEFSDGYPGIADLLINSQVNGSLDIATAGLSDSALYSRLIHGTTDPSGDKNTKKVLMYFSIFSKIGYKGPAEKEARWLADCSGIPWDDFREIVSHQQRRGLLQGKYYLNLSPFMLKVFLLREWWNILGFNKDSFLKFVNDMPADIRQDLLSRFLDTIPLISESLKGKEFAKELLGLNGLFFDFSSLQEEINAKLFLKLTETDPDSAMNCLTRVMGKKTRKELLEFTTGRREIIRSLERLSFHRKHFIKAARILLKLAESENETWSNNASGVFRDLFSIGWGPLAPTGASPMERFPVLEEALESDSKEIRLIGYSACGKALETRNISRSVGSERQGLNVGIKPWTPDTNVEIFDAVKYVWTLLREKLPKLDVDEEKIVFDTLLSHSRSLLGYPSLSKLVVDTINEFSDEYPQYKKTQIYELNHVIQFDGERLPKSLLKNLRNIEKKLIGEDFHSKLYRYAAMNIYEESYDKAGKTNLESIENIEKLASEAIQNPELLQPELDWLVTTEAENAYKFGLALGHLDENYSLLQQILEAQKGNADSEGFSVFFLSGYFKAIFEQDETQLEDKMDMLMKDKTLTQSIPELTWRTNLSDRAGIRILKLAKDNIIGPSQFRQFTFGGVIKNLSSATFSAWIEYLLHDSSSEAISISIQLYDYYYDLKDSSVLLPKEMTFELLTHSSLFEEKEENPFSNMDDYHWAKIGIVFANQNPNKGLAIAKIMLSSLGLKGTILGSFYGQNLDVLNLISQREPKEVWNLIIQYFGPPIGSRAYNITEWLRGGEFNRPKEGALKFFSIDDITSWIKGDSENRAWYTATFVPKDIYSDDKSKSYSRALLIEFGDRDDVRRNLQANYYSEGWSGSSSSHYLNKKRGLNKLKNNETDANVLLWLEEFISSLEYRIESSIIEEEKEGFY